MAKIDHAARCDAYLIGWLLAAEQLRRELKRKPTTEEINRRFSEKVMGECKRVIAYCAAKSTTS